MWTWLPLAGEKAIRYRPANVLFSNGDLQRKGKKCTTTKETLATMPKKLVG